MRPILRVLAGSPGLALAASLLAALPQPALAAAPGPARASQTEYAFLLENQAVQARIPTAGDKLSGITVTDAANARSVSLPELFTLDLKDGRKIAASGMALSGAPMIGDLPVEPGAARASDRLPGKEICADLTSREPALKVRWCAILRDGSNYVRQQVTIQSLGEPLAITEVRLLDFADPGAHVSGTVKGSPIADGTMFFGFEHPLSESRVTDGQASAWLTRVLPLQPHQAVTYSSVIGVAPPGQMRRAFLRYVERERAHPYRTFLHYNTWYDLGYDNRYDEAGALNRIHAFGEELVVKRHVVMDSFLFDDGWDNPSTLWGFNSGFPDGFTRVREAAARYHFGIGVWLSPWGGYDQAKKRRMAYGRTHGYEIVNGGYALSGPRYYPEFERTCLEMIEKYGVNQFKFDGTGNAEQVIPGSRFDSDFAAAIHLIERLRQQQPNVFINLTTGTYPSPFWLRYADSIWRGGDDHSFAGVGTWRQRWITYRDEQTYRNIVLGGPLFPLNSLMLHGLIYARYAKHLKTDPGHDFSAEVRSYFGSGTQLQEMYITPSLLSQQDWDILAECAKWSRANAAVLKDTHWIGGDPGKLEVYGWAAWTPEKAVVTLRNPSNRAQSFALDAGKAFQRPTGAAQRYTAHSVWTGSPLAVALTAGQPHTFTLKPFEVLTLEAEPEARK